MPPILIAAEVHESFKPLLAVSAAWFDHGLPPRFNYTRFDVVKDNILATATVKNTAIDRALNAVALRTIEKLYIADCIPSTDIRSLDIYLLLKPRYRELDLDVPKKIVRSHWLITAARALLREEVRKEHVQYIRKRGRKAPRR